VKAVIVTASSKLAVAATFPNIEERNARSSRMEVVFYLTNPKTIKTNKLNYQGNTVGEQTIPARQEVAT
jgi:hypothetical protein